MKKLFSLALFFLAFKAQAQDLDAALRTKIDDEVKQYVEGVSPGIAVGIVKGGEVVYQNYLGYANLEHQIKIDEKTRFNIASNAKQFTALCILRLCEEGKISLDDDFREYLPNLYKNIKEEITISNLLTHTSGIRDYCDLYALTGRTWWKHFDDNDDVIELLEAQTDLNFKPNTEYLYSNSNYILLAQIVTEVMGKDFHKLAKDMFESMGMDHTAFVHHYARPIPHKADPYGNWGGWRKEATITEFHGDGALFTTLPDQLRWEQIVQQNNGEALPQEIIEKSQLPIKRAFTQGYGYGLFFDKRKELNYVFHDGVTGAYNATFLRFPTQKISIVVMGNNRNIIANNVAWGIAYHLLGLTADERLYPANPDKTEELAQIQDVLGAYKGEGEDGTMIKIVERNGALYREIYQRDPVKLVHEKESLFEYETIQGLKMNFRNIGKQNQCFTLYRSSQRPSTYYKFSSLIADDFSKTALNGTFYNSDTDTKIILKYVEGDTYTLIKNGQERKAVLLLQDYLRMMDSYEIRVIRDKYDKIIGLNVKNNRIKNVIFEKVVTP
ncbi:MAG: serine hydrolase domain-containing protein [Bacteroidota bacterium]